MFNAQVAMSNECANGTNAFNDSTIATFIEY